MKHLASLPRTRPEEGKVYAVVSLKRPNGTRMEISGTFDEQKFLALWTQIHLAGVIDTTSASWPRRD